MMSSGLFAPGWSFQVAVTSVSETIIDANRFGAVFGSQLSVGEIHAEHAEIVDKDVSLVKGCLSSCPLESEVLKTWEVTNGSTLLNESSSSVIWVGTRGNAAKFTSVGNIAMDEDEGEGLSRQKFAELDLCHCRMLGVLADESSWLLDSSSSSLLASCSLMEKQFQFPAAESPSAPTSLGLLF